MKLPAGPIKTLNAYLSIRLLTIVLFFFLTGFTAGVFTEIQLSDEARKSMADFLSYNVIDKTPAEGGLSGLFLNSIALNGTLFLIILLAGLSIVGFPLALPALAYKGAALGFSAALLIDSLGGKGLLFIAFKLLPPNIFLIPAFCGAAAAALKFGFGILSGGLTNIKRNLTVKSGSYLFFQILMGILVLAGCLVESLIAPL